MIKYIFCVVALIYLTAMPVRAEELNIDFGELNNQVDEKTGLSFNELLEKLMSGENVFAIVKDNILDAVKDSIFKDGNFVKAIVIISVISALVNIVASDIKDKSVAELVGLIGQLMIVGVSAATFKSSIDLLQKGTMDIVDIVNSAVPFIAMLLVSTGNTMAIGGGGIIALGASVVAGAITSVIIPALVISTLLKLVNIISDRELVSKLSELFMYGVKTSLKFSAYIFVFLVSLEKISGGIINKGVGGTLKSLIKMVPVIGDVIGGISDTTLSTISAISSGVGLVIVLILVVVVSVPILQILVTALLFKLMAAVLEPICDKKTVDIIDTIGEGNLMVLSALFLISAMFVLSSVIILCGII